jgi:hypothetical protein
VKDAPSGKYGGEKGRRSDQPPGELNPLKEGERVPYRLRDRQDQEEAEGKPDGGGDAVDCLRVGDIPGIRPHSQSG